MLKQDLLVNTIFLVIALTILYTISVGSNYITGLAVLNTTSFPEQGNATIPGANNQLVQSSDQTSDKIKGMLGAMPYVSVLSDTDLCIMISSGNGSDAYNVEKKPDSTVVTKSEEFCNGLDNEDFVILFKAKDAFDKYASEPICSNFVEGVGVDYEVLPSKQVEQGGNIICTDDFKNRFCDSFNQCVSEGKLIEADLSCCVTHELTEEQKVLLKRHLVSGRYIDETGQDLSGIKLPEEKKSVLSALNVLGSDGNGIIKWALYIVIMGAIVGGAIFYYTKKRGAKEVKTETNQPPSGQLHDYIEQTLQQGYNFSQIKEALIEQGWPEDAIDREIMDYYQKSQGAQQQELANSYNN